MRNQCENLPDYREDLEPMIRHTQIKKFGAWPLALASLLSACALKGQTGDSHEASQHLSHPPAPATAPVSQAFTGKVRVHCAALRAAPTAEALAVFECERALLIRVTGSEGEFYQILPPDGLKAYIARKFVADGKVKGQHVNLRARPNTESAILSQVNEGDAITTAPLAKAPDWLELTYPADRKLYIRKDLVEQVGDESAYSALRSQQGEIAQYLQEARAMTQEARAQFANQTADPTSWDRIQTAYERALQLALSSPAFTEMAHDIVQQQQVAFREYQKWFSEFKPQLTTQELPQSAAKGRAQGLTPTSEPESAAPSHWAEIEQLRANQWLDTHPEKSESHYRQEQEQQSEALEGAIAPYIRTDLRQKPGDFLLYRNDAPTAYLYSSQLDLGEFVGKTCKLRAIKRDDMGFALPAYCVLSIES